MCRVTEDTADNPVKGLVFAAGLSLVLFWAMSLGTASHSGLASWDGAIIRFFTEHSSDPVVSAARQITSFGVVGVLLPAAVIGGIAILLATRSAVLAAAPWVSVQVTSGLVSTLKRHFGTPRPPLADQVIVVRSPAFPSGHAADTVALVVSVALIIGVVLMNSKTRRRLVYCAAAVAGAVMGATRLILNVHWFSDVIGGVCLGFSVAALCVAGGLFVTSGHRQ